MNPIAFTFRRPRMAIFLALWVAFSAGTFFIACKGIDRSGRTPVRLAATTAATILGPMTGAVARDLQGCCLKFSISLIPWCGGFLMGCALVQLMRWPLGRFAGAVHLVLWALGWIAWFMGGFVSFLHALS